jgi:hypothetical protein
MAVLMLPERFVDHPKLIELTPSGRWKWVTVLAHCACHKTGGTVGRGTLRQLRISRRLLQQLVDVGLLEPDADAGAFRVRRLDDQ